MPRAQNPPPVSDYIYENIHLRAAAATQAAEWRKAVPRAIRGRVKRRAVWTAFRVSLFSVAGDGFWGEPETSLAVQALRDAAQRVVRDLKPGHDPERYRLLTVAAACHLAGQDRPDRSYFKSAHADQLVAACAEPLASSLQRERVIASCAGFVAQMTCEPNKLDSRWAATCVAATLDGFRLLHPCACGARRSLRTLTEFLRR